MEDYRIYDATTMLEWWGLRESGGSLKNPVKKSTGGDPAEDDEKAAMVFVQTTQFFRVARPILAHVHIEGKQLDEFVIRMPGERLKQSLLRLGWWQLCGVREERIADCLYEGFYEVLTNRLEFEGFIPPSKLPRLIDEHEGPVTERERELMELGRRTA